MHPIQEKIHKAEKTFQPANFTIKELRSAIPSHLFKKSTLKSFSYLLYDFVGMTTLAYLSSHIQYLPLSLRLLAWPLYWIGQGIICTGIWVLAHECGHQAFSDSKLINDVVGWVLHSSLLVPYYSWKISHSLHHKGTNHLIKDQVFVPKTKKDKFSNDSQGSFLDFMKDSPIYQVYQMLSMLLLGWPLYLLFNVSGPKYSQNSSHFDPNSLIFEKKHFHQIVISDIGIFLTLSVLTYYSFQHSLTQVMFYYGIPYLMVNFWLVLITYLQHTDPVIPHYRDQDWNFIRGALSTVDRDFGVLNHLFHHITDTHIVHHLFSTMPHYNAVEATKRIRKVLGPYYQSDSTHWAVALWNNLKYCSYVDDEGSILFWRS